MKEPCEINVHNEVIIKKQENTIIIVRLGL